jgi:hypothetical protein
VGRVFSGSSKDYARVLHSDGVIGNSEKFRRHQTCRTPPLRYVAAACPRFRCLGVHYRAPLRRQLARLAYGGSAGKLCKVPWLNREFPAHLERNLPSLTLPSSSTTALVNTRASGPSFSGDGRCQSLTRFQSFASLDVQTNLQLLTDPFISRSTQESSCIVSAIP